MSFILKKAAGKVIGKRAQGIIGDPQDPYIEVYVDKKGREKRRVRRDVPPGLSQRDAQILKSVRKRAHRLDKGFSLCGIRFGYSAFLDLIPVIGDGADFALSYALVLRKAREAELPADIVAQMVANNVIGAAFGLVPFIGEVLYRANTRNAIILEQYLTKRGALSLTGSAHATELRG